MLTYMSVQKFFPDEKVTVWRAVSLAPDSHGDVFQIWPRYDAKGCVLLTNGKRTLLTLNLL